MTYVITLPKKIYRLWDSYREYDKVADVISFNNFVTENYPECVSVSYALYSPGLLDMTFIFKSEAHYTWFLLQQ